MDMLAIQISVIHLDILAHFTGKGNKSINVINCGLKIGEGYTIKISQIQGSHIVLYVL